LEDEYSDVLEIFQRINLAPKTMIDAGANIGLATLYFKAYYPELNIVALEPTRETYLRLKQNCEINELKNVSPLEQGLWKQDTLLRLDKSFRDGKDWSFRLVEGQNSDSNSIKARSVASLMNENGWECLDFLKIDIEGGEVVVFENHDAVKDWLPRVKVLSIEIHDEFNCRESIYALLKENNFVLQESKSIVIATNAALV
jgi:FkbM family methyltransferase